MVFHFDCKAVVRSSGDVKHSGSQRIELDFLLTSEILIADSDNESARDPLRNNALADFRLGSDIVWDGERGFIEFGIMEQRSDMFLADLVPVEESDDRVGQPNAVAIFPIRV